ncbi:hypothetical protein J421_0413 [Gemmatirosa kalamazoonensis]|uniref:STAS/SEC14 domain-containing protein n=1 Tax=Gemmatirosa kalamazoonensis TaxID=861299 RepID=W0RC97_9BACT|nr:STAS/SEC14 domain-containing protein [Gemmatirosa kalamazoonensis]AHG87950.1 hypothetical protein J421_0413 [Gemmatirosa kalamazoonensis]
MAFALWMEGDLIRIRIHDTITPRDLRALADAVLEAEARVLPMPNRLTDMTDVTGVEVGFAEFLAFTERRLGMVLPNPIKSALVVASRVQLGIARMFQTLNDHPQVTVEIFHELGDALSWLATPPSADAQNGPRG